MPRNRNQGNQQRNSRSRPGSSQPKDVAGTSHSSKSTPSVQVPSKARREERQHAAAEKRKTVILAAIYQVLNLPILVFCFYLGYELLRPLSRRELDLIDQRVPAWSILPSTLR